MLEAFKTLISGILEVAKSYKGDWNENDSSSPNYVKNRTHYTTEDDVVLFEDYSISIESGPVTFPLPDDKGLIIGETYKVIWDEIEYNCQAFEVNGMSVIGNSIPMGGNDTGEPFFVATGITYYDTAESDNMCIIFGEQGEHVFSIYKKGEVVHKLDKKYLPEDIDEVIKDKFHGGVGYMIPAGTELVNIEVNGGSNTWLSDISFLSSGMYYYVSFNDFNGYLEAYIDENGDISLGNREEYGFILYQYGGIVVGRFDVSGTLIVKTDEELPIPIDSRFIDVQLPEDIVTLDNMPAIRYDIQQNLQSWQKLNARDNIGAGTSNFSGSYKDLTNKPTIYTDVIRYATQNLSDNEKATARANINVYSKEETYEKVKVQKTIYLSDSSFTESFWVQDSSSTFLKVSDPIMMAKDFREVSCSNTVTFNSTWEADESGATIINGVAVVDAPGTYSMRKQNSSAVYDVEIPAAGVYFYVELGQTNRSDKVNWAILYPQTRVIPNDVRNIVRTINNAEPDENGNVNISIDGLSIKEYIDEAIGGIENGTY